MRWFVLAAVLFGSSPEYLLLDYPSPPSSAARDPWVKQKKIFYGHFAISPSCFVFVSHMLPFLWQMELSKEVKDDAVQLCGSGVMKPGAFMAWQQEPRDTAGPLIWPRRTEQKLPSSS